MSKAGSAMSWTKIAEDGFDGAWATDKMIKNKGQHKFTVPKVAAGDYILRPEIIALHEGNRAGGAQFYHECIHVKVSGSGVALPAGVSMPGYLTAQTPGVLFDIYGGFSTYTIPGPKVWNGAGAAAPAAPVATTTKAAAPAATTTKAAAPTTTKAAAPTTLATVTKPAPTAVAGGAAVQKYAQCGGQGYSGATSCASGSKCTKQNDYYSQCI
jgi:cellulase